MQGGELVLQPWIVRYIPVSIENGLQGLFKGITSGETIISKWKTLCVIFFRKGKLYAYFFERESFMRRIF